MCDLFFQDEFWGDRTLPDGILNASGSGEYRNYTRRLRNESAENGEASEIALALA
jgi:hypothetical protein